MLGTRWIWKTVSYRLHTLDRALACEAEVFAEGKKHERQAGLGTGDLEKREERQVRLKLLLPSFYCCFWPSL